MGYVSSFNTEVTPNALAFVTRDSLKIGTVESIQRLHIKTIPLGETPRRIAYQEVKKVFGLLTTKGLSPEEDISHIRLVDDQTFEILDSYALDKFEVVQSLISCDFEDPQNPVFVAGTAFILPTEEEPSKGRIIVFQVTDFRKIMILQQLEVKGCVYSLAAFEKTQVVAGINSKVELFQWDQKTDPQNPSLTSLCAHFGYIVALTIAVTGSFVVVGDLMKSVSVLTYNSMENKFKESYRDYATNWMTAVEALDEDHFIGADNHLNIFTLKKYVDEKEVHMLIEDGQFHMGQFFLSTGSLVPLTPDDDRPVEPVLIYASVFGSLGIVGRVNAKYEQVLQRLETMLSQSKFVPSIGRLDHDKWRTFAGERGRRLMSPRQIVDGDLIVKFLDLSTEKKLEIFEAVKDECVKTMEDLNKVVQDLSRLH